MPSGNKQTKKKKNTNIQHLGQRLLSSRYQSSPFGLSSARNTKTKVVLPATFIGLYYTIRDSHHVGEQIEKCRTVRENMSTKRPKPGVRGVLNTARRYVFLLMERLGLSLM